MRFFNWLRHGKRTQRTRRPSPRSANRYVPRLEQLEGRGLAASAISLYLKSATASAASMDGSAAMRTSEVSKGDDAIQLQPDQCS